MAPRPEAAPLMARTILVTTVLVTVMKRSVAPASAWDAVAPNPKVARTITGRIDSRL